MQEQRPFITVVTGLPRSGTSMMMKMLDAGGMPTITDHQRVADGDNPHGYYEFEPVKNLREDASWLPDAIGSAVKIIYLLLCDLPATHEYRLVFMRRDLDEVIASQERMLANRGEPSPVPASQVAELFNKHLTQVDTWLAERDNFKILNVPYQKVVANPQDTAIQIQQFLGRDLDTGAMTKIVDPGLYRQRAANKS